MRVVIAMMKHETNTFSPVPTPLSRFGNDGPYWGEAALKAYEGTGTPMGAFIHLARAEGAEMVTPVAAEAWPSGRVDDDAYRRLSDAIAEAVAKGCDLVLLDLHGAMVSQSIDDGDGALVERLRGIAPDTPIVAAFDLHANLSGKVVANATAVAGFKTYPHIDMYETGLRIGRIGFDTAKGECRPTMAWGNRPMLPHVMRQATEDAPMNELVHAARIAETGPTVLAASLCAGFPHADIYDSGLGAVVGSEQESRQYAGFVAFLLIIPVFFITQILSAPDSPLVIALTLIPVTSPVTVIFRTAISTVPAWQIATSLGIMLICTVLITWLSAKVFRWAILLYGKSVTPKTLWHVITGSPEMGTLPPGEATQAAKEQTA